MKRLFYLFIIFLCVSCSVQKGFPNKKLKLATTTSTYETGLLDYLLKPFNQKYNVEVHIISVGTGKAMKIGENGDVDLILVHARKAEEKFIKKGYGVNRRDVMYNDFVIIGPKNDPAKISGSKNVSEALKKISKQKALFISRGDDSGTHKKEISLWNATGLTPFKGKNSWYLESGQGMSATLRIADQKKGYVLIDRGTFIFNEKKTRLRLHVQGDKKLYNPYGVIAVNPFRHNHVKYELSMLLIAWLTSPDGQQMIDKFRVNGKKLFNKNAERSEK